MWWREKMYFWGQSRGCTPSRDFVGMKRSKNCCGGRVFKVKRSAYSGVIAMWGRTGPNMAQGAGMTERFNIVAVGQSGRLSYEAVLLAASLRTTNPDFDGRLLIAVPQNGPKWASDPVIYDVGILGLLEQFGAEVVPFESVQFGSDYPYGNKIECLAAIPDEPFLFVDTDTVFTGPLAQVGFDFARPSASMKREGTWPVLELYGPGYNAIWKSLYDRFGLDFVSSLDTGQPD
jgi:hypothetical protein